MKSSTILGVGHYVPTRVVTNHDLAEMMSTSDEWIVQRSGIKERRFIEHSGIGASDLAVPASKMALEHAGIEAKEVDAIIFATLSPDHNFPGSGCFLGHKLGLPGVPALDVRNQCSGFLYGLSIADAHDSGGSSPRYACTGRYGQAARRSCCSQARPAGPPSTWSVLAPERCDEARGRRPFPPHRSAREYA